MNEYFVNEEQYQRVATFLSRQAAKFNLSPDVMARMKPTPSELYVKSKFNAGGNVPLLNGNSTQEVGVTNFDGNRLDNGRFFVIDSVTLLYGEAADSKKVWEVDYNKEIPAELKASHLVRYRRLGALAVIEPTQTVDLTIETPAGSSITTANGSDKSFVQVLFKGFETYMKR